MIIIGRGAYMKHLDKLYKLHDISWFTPVELFKVNILYFNFVLLNLDISRPEIINVEILTRIILFFVK